MRDLDQLVSGPHKLPSLRPSLVETEVRSLEKLSFSWRESLEGDYADFPFVQHLRNFLFEEYDSDRG
jgi:hypothetical protein